MRNFFLLICASFWLALFLTFLPMPVWAMWCRPVWVLITLIFWVLFFPSRINMGIACCFGLIMDLLSGTLLGEHALAYTLIIYWVNRMHLRVRLYSLLEQGLFVFSCVLFYLFVLYCIQGVIGELPASPWYWMPALTSTIIWPWLFVLLRDCCQRFNAR